MIMSSSKCSLASARGFILELDRIKGVGSYLTATAEIDHPRKVRGTEKKLWDSLLTPLGFTKKDIELRGKIGLVLGERRHKKL